MQQQEIDTQNANFWNELCGTSLARNIGITNVTPESLKKFDQAYMRMYPYLSGYVTSENLTNKKVLEIGLGYGTLGQFIASQPCEYYGLDIAEGPVAMMTDRLKFIGKESEAHVRVGSALEIPFSDESFDFVYSIGCLHHTGNIPRGVAEVYRVLRPGGKAVVMLYNRHSFRQMVQVPLYHMKTKLLAQRKDFSEFVRALYDTDSKGGAAPHTEYVSRADVKRIFGKFSKIKIDPQNCDTYVLFPGVVIRRELLLSSLGRTLGLDLYIVAQK
jgi:ubiquinone/menaquinone biosynthesis C-methylase UbiE